MTWLANLARVWPSRGGAHTSQKGSAAPSEEESSCRNVGLPASKSQHSGAADTSSSESLSHGGNGIAVVKKDGVGKRRGHRGRFESGFRDVSWDRVGEAGERRLLRLESTMGEKIRSDSELLRLKI